MFLTTKALVLREVKYKEADKMLTVLTETEGKVSVKARGAMRKGCKYAAATQMPSYSEMTLFGNQGRWSINEAETLEQFIGLRNDIAALALASYFCELLEAVSDEDSPNPEVMRVGLNSLFALSRELYPAEKIKAAFELRLMCLSGYEPMLDACGECGEVDITHPTFDVNGGMVRCSECGGGGHRTMPMCPDSLAAARYIVSAEPKRFLGFELDGEPLSKLGAVCEEYALTQLDRGFASLEYWKSVK